MKIIVLCAGGVPKSGGIPHFYAIQYITCNLYIPVGALVPCLCELALQAGSRPIDEKWPCMREVYDCMFARVLTRICFLARLQGIPVQFLDDMVLLFHKKCLWMFLQYMFRDMHNAVSRNSGKDERMKQIVQMVGLVLRMLVWPFWLMMRFFWFSSNQNEDQTIPHYSYKAKRNRKRRRRSSRRNARG